jgi:uncharacterized protein
MEFIKNDDGKRGVVFAIENNAELGAMTYTWAGTDKIIIDHTEVNSEYNGQGVGKKILEQIIDWARKEQIKIIPLCPFAKAQFEKNSEFRDVLM